MDKKYQVFVSSTFEDLKEEREKIIENLPYKNCIPAGMEYFPAANDEHMPCRHMAVRKAQQSRKGQGHQTR